MNMELLKFIAEPVRKNVRKGDKVLILSDFKTEKEIQDALVAAVIFQEAVPVLMIIPPVKVFGNEPPEMVAKAAKESDLVIIACSTAMGHTNAIRGNRYLTMSGVTVKSLTTGAATADYNEVYRLTREIADIVTTGSIVHVTTEKGTDITLSVEGRKATPLASVVDEDGQGKAAFPDGEVAIAPVEGTANGVIVVDGSIHHFGLVKEDVRLIVKEGRVVQIDGGKTAKDFYQFVKENGDENSFNIAEFALGTNYAASITANTQDAKKTIGTVHFALGDNITLGGHTYSKIHMDMVVSNCTVSIDGKLILKDNRFIHKSP
ncbi:MAG TPA: aminopeptidase [Clostridiaceae bacterium]|nr:aminopeptidase [Clostridiaceae bacterium]